MSGKDKMNSERRGPKNVSSSTVREEMRILFNKQLRRLREDEVSEIVFPSTLNNIERKFLHSLAEELGLKSRSRGIVPNRYITVTKANSTNEAAFANFSLRNDSIEQLELYLQSTSLPISSNFGSANTNPSSHHKTKQKIHKKNIQPIIESYNVAQQTMLSKPNYNIMKLKRSQLPAFSHHQEVCSLVKDHQIVLVSGETGCGKSTQVPQFLLDDPTIGPTCQIVITQPRRLSAISIAERIASERCETVGQSVGYNIRMETERSSKTQLLFVTPGVLLRKLYNDPTLMEFSHIIIDEAHERDYQTEFLLIILKDVCSRRKDMKLILMSATLNTDKLATYFRSGANEVPHIHMGGSVFPVQEFYLEHALMYTKYLESKVVHVPFGRSGPPSTPNAMGIVLQSQSFSCAICGGGPFLSPEELGTHAATCIPPLPDSRTSDKSNKIPSRKYADNNNNNNIKRPSLKDIVNAVTQNSSASQRWTRGDNNETNMTVNNVEVEVELTKDNEDENEEVNHSDGDSDSDGEDAAAAVMSSAALTRVDEIDTVADDLLRQYHLLWDDSQ
eukprot:gene10633-22198_t